jgi:DNA-binding ferritin-like protein
MKFSIEQAQQDVLSEVAMLLLHGVTAAHVHHWNTLGPGSFAEHEAIGEFYEELEDLADSLIEGCLLGSKIISAQGALFLGETSASLVQHIYDRMSVLRKSNGFPQESEVQNVVDEIQMLCRHTLFKLNRLK